MFPGDLCLSAIVSRKGYRGSPEKRSPSKYEQKNLSPSGINLPQNASEAKDFWVRTAQRSRTSMGTTPPRGHGQSHTSPGQHASPKSPNMGYDFSQSVRGTQQQTLANLMSVGAGQLPIGGALASALLSNDDDDEDAAYLDKNVLKSDGELDGYVVGTIIGLAFVSGLVF